MVANTPGNCALFWGSRCLICLAFNTQVHYVIATDSAVVYNNIPGPQGDRWPFLYFESLLSNQGSWCGRVALVHFHIVVAHCELVGETLANKACLKIIWTIIPTVLLLFTLKEDKMRVYTAKGGPVFFQQRIRWHCWTSSNARSPARMRPPAFRTARSTTCLRPTRQASSWQANITLDFTTDLTTSFNPF